MKDRRINRIDLENTREEIIKFGLELFSIFSNLDTLRIFLYAQDGIDSSRRAMKELGLTPKRYYSRLKDLVEMGVLEKGEGRYRYTPLGKALYQLGYYLLDVLRNKDRLRIIGELMKSNLLEPQETERVLEIISSGSQGLELVLKSLDSSGKMEVVERITTYDELVEKLVEDIKTANNQVLLASRYIDMRVVEACTRVLKRRLELRVLLAEENLSSKLSRLRLFLSPTALKMMVEVLSMDIKVEEFVREGRIPYSFCVVDGEICFFEFPSIIEDEFSIAFRVVDKQAAEKFTRIFQELWDKSGTKMMFDFLGSLNRKR